MIEYGNDDKNCREPGSINAENNTDISTAGKKISNIKNIPINI